MTAMSEAQCTECAWTLPSGRHTSPGTPERPGNADYVDAAMPQISAHIDQTGHPVSVTLTTLHPPQRQRTIDHHFHPRGAQDFPPNGIGNPYGCTAIGVHSGRDRADPSDSDRPLKVPTRSAVQLGHLGVGSAGPAADATPAAASARRYDCRTPATCG